MENKSRLIVNEAEPTPIVKDFGIFIEFFRNNRVVLTAKSQQLPKAPLYELNKLMSTYVTEDNPNFKFILPFSFGREIAAKGSTQREQV